MIEKIYNKFKTLFNDEPTLFRSPGRINLIGEHTDYNKGFILPSAIDKEIVFAISKRDDKDCNLFAFDLNKSFGFNIENFKKSESVWANYLIGIIDQFQKRGIVIDGFNCVFGGNIPIGAGLSSSAAIETGLAFALNSIFNLQLDKIDLVKLSQKSENDFVGVRCGIMDQFINIFGKENFALRIDCRNLQYEYFPLSLNNYQLVLIDTQIKHKLASGEYNKRREQCELGVQLLQKVDKKIQSLRDVKLDLLLRCKSELDEIIFKRCKYVIRENERLLTACEDLKNMDLISFGKKMFETHYGLKNDYEVSCKELDFLVEIAELSPIVIGARMMGGGFGGCTINLIKADSIDNFTSKAEEEFQKFFNRKIKIYKVKTVNGTSGVVNI